MKRLAIAAALLSITGSAFAADMALKASPAAATANMTWAGFYLGGDIGARWSDAQWTTDDFGPGRPASPIDNPAKLDRTSIRFGGYLGYNWMLAPIWVAGVEADIGSGGGTTSHTPFPGQSVFGIAGSGVGTDFVNAKLGWDGSVRGRLGYLIAPTWLVYATGGVAWQSINTSASCTGTGISYCVGAFSESSTATKAGWTAGVGVETMLWSHWVGRAEYRYADFGHVTNTFPPAPNFGFDASIRVHTNTALLGLAYKFGP